MASSSFFELLAPDRGPVLMDFCAPGGTVFGPGFSGPPSPPGPFLAVVGVVFGVDAGWVVGVPPPAGGGGVGGGRRGSRS